MKHFALTMMTAVLLLPGTAHAYLEPEDVLFGDIGSSDDDGLHGAASSAPSSRARSSASSEEGLHGAAPEQPGLTPREERILQRVENRQTSSAPTYQAPQNEVLHSGAPAMSHTGPETAIALALLAVTVLATLVFARTGRIDFSQK